MNIWTPEAVRAEMDYRLERARAAAVATQVRQGRQSWLRRLRVRTTAPPTTPRVSAATTAQS